MFYTQKISAFLSIIAGIIIWVQALAQSLVEVIPYKMIGSFFLGLLWVVIGCLYFSKYIQISTVWKLCALIVLIILTAVVKLPIALVCIGPLAILFILIEVAKNFNDLNEKEPRK